MQITETLVSGLRVKETRKLDALHRIDQLTWKAALEVPQGIIIFAIVPHLHRSPIYEF